DSEYIDCIYHFFFFESDEGILYRNVTGVQTCALPIYKSEKEIKRISKTVDKIEALDEQMQALSDEELRAKTTEFKERLANGETLDRKSVVYGKSGDRGVVWTRWE